MPADKHRIARAFSAAAAHYDQAAGLQREVGHTLLDLLKRHSGSIGGKRIADIGCGSGYFAAILQTQADVWALDFAEGMLHRAAAQGIRHCILADAETLPLADNSMDMCFSSLAVQWCDLPRAVAEMCRVTRPNGILAVATLLDGSLWQIGQSWQCVDNQPHIHTFLNTDDIRRAFCACQPVYLHEETRTLHFPDCRQALRSLKNIGANHVHGRHGGLMGKQRWQRFQAAYRMLCGSDGSWPLDYRVGYVVAVV